MFFFCLALFGCCFVFFVFCSLSITHIAATPDTHSFSRFWLLSYPPAHRKQSHRPISLLTRGRPCASCCRRRPSPPSETKTTIAATASKETRNEVRVTHSCFARFLFSLSFCYRVVAAAARAAPFGLIRGRPSVLCVCARPAPSSKGGRGASTFSTPTHNQNSNYFRSIRHTQNPPNPPLRFSICKSVPLPHQNPPTPPMHPTFPLTTFLYTHPPKPPKPLTCRAAP